MPFSFFLHNYIESNELILLLFNSAHTHLAEQQLVGVDLLKDICREQTLRSDQWDFVHEVVLVGIDEDIVDGVDILQLVFGSRYLYRMTMIINGKR